MELNTCALFITLYEHQKAGHKVFFMINVSLSIIIRCLTTPVILFIIKPFFVGCIITILYLLCFLFLFCFVGPDLEDNFKRVSVSIRPDIECQNYFREVNSIKWLQEKHSLCLFMKIQRKYLRSRLSKRSKSKNCTY